MVILYAYLESRLLANEPKLMRDLYLMVRDYDNNAASRIIDKITHTQSGSTLDTDMLQLWNYKCQKLNRFFQNAGYILAIFGDDPAYGKSRTIFPEMSRLVFDRMKNRQ